MSKRFARVLGLTAVLGGGLWLFTFGSFEQEIRYSVPADFDLPSFRLAQLDEGLAGGDTVFVTAEELRGSVVLVAFWATWCSPCIAEQPSYLALQEEFRSEGFRLVGIQHGESPEKTWRWLQENDREGFRTLIGTSQLARTIRIGGLPHSLLVDRRGRVVERLLGWWPERDEYLRGRIEELLSSDRSRERS